MKTTEAIAWLGELLDPAWTSAGEDVDANDRAVVAWLAEVEAFLDATLPPHHAVRRRWHAQLARAQRFASNRPSEIHITNELLAVLDAASRILTTGRLTSLLDAVRAETVVELLEQAENLLNGGHLVAATVAAGGALETHLRHLCTRTLVPIEGSGSIEKYKAAFDRSRKAGNETVSLADTKQITAWADLRNEAAHSPTSFKATSEQVRLMIAGIRDFVARLT